MTKPVGRRIAIVGTAPSWKNCPFDDPTLEIWALNDAYTLGLPRVDRWFEQHPLDHLYFRPTNQRVVYAHDVPYGFYVRPEGHIETLKAMARTIPVYLQSEPPAGWPPNARRFPIEEADALFGEWWASGPSYEVALAIMEGVSEIQVWGIHLETEQEYRDQRENFSHLLGIARGRGIKVVMAPQSPLMRHPWKYAYEPKPAMHPAKATLLQVRQEKAKLLQQLAQWPRFKSKASVMDRVRRLDALEMDSARAMSQRVPIVIEAPVLGVA